MDTKLQVTQVDVKSLKLAEYNPRKWTDFQEQALKESIKKFGLVDPIIVNSAPKRKGTVIGGHFRLKVAKELGYKTVPVVYINIPDIKKEKELNIRLNKNTGEFDLELLADFDEDMLADIGFDNLELDEIFPILLDEKDDEIPAPPKKAKSKLGDMFALGGKIKCPKCGKETDI